jgi:hypothetical protein
MRLYELEAGNRKELVNSNIDLYIQTIKTRCSDALSAMQTTKEFLYRGVQTGEINQFKGKSRESRKPLMTTGNQQEEIDNILRNHGFEALRSNSIFCSSTMSQVQNYGRVYMIFPVNGFDFTWSPKYNDLFAVSDLNQYATGEKLMNIIAGGDYRMNNFTAALGSGNEIMIKGEYYAFRNQKYVVDFAKLLLDIKL